jgi:DUF2934 family protein
MIDQRGHAMKANQTVSKATTYAHGRPAGLEEEIRRRAYQIYEERDRCEGHSLDDWLRAEAEILSHRVMRRVAQEEHALAA